MTRWAAPAGACDGRYRLRLGAMTAHADEDFDPEHPDVQHEERGESTDDPADAQMGYGTELNPGELPAEIPGAPGELPAPEVPF